MLQEIGQYNAYVELLEKFYMQCLIVSSNFADLFHQMSRPLLNDRALNFWLLYLHDNLRELLKSNYTPEALLEEYCNQYSDMSADFDHKFYAIEKGEYPLEIKYIKSKRLTEKQKKLLAILKTFPENDMAFPNQNVSPLNIK